MAVSRVKQVVTQLYDSFREACFGRPNTSPLQCPKQAEYWQSTSRTLVRILASGTFRLLCSVMLWSNEAEGSHPRTKIRCCRSFKVKPGLKIAPGVTMEPSGENVPFPAGRFCAHPQDDSSGHNRWLVKGSNHRPILN